MQHTVKPLHEPGHRDPVPRAETSAKGQGRAPGTPAQSDLPVRRQIGDEARFLKSWFNKPLVTGAVSPSGRHLARMMARYIDPTGTGSVVELGPGTGPVTEALIARGVAPGRLVLIEYNPEFVTLLRKRFPGVTVVQGDAYDITRTLGSALEGPAAGVVSSLPLFTKPEASRLRLLGESFGLMAPGAPFVQFTYGPISPMPLKAGGFSAHVSPRVWWNLPPARVWVYRHTAA